MKAPASTYDFPPHHRTQHSLLLLLLPLIGWLAVAPAQADPPPLLIRGFQSFGVPDAGVGWSKGLLNVQVADMNGDGKLDVIAQGNNGRLYVCLGNGDGTFGPAVVNHTYGVAENAKQVAGGVAVGDVNGDGKMDIAVVDSIQGLLYIYLGKGDGTLGQGKPYHPGASTGSTTIGIVSADFNRDGLADFAVVNQSDKTMAIYYGTSAGLPVTGATFPLPAAYNSGLSVADFNRDGWPDVYMPVSGELLVLRNNQQNGFVAQTFSGLSTKYPTGAAAVNYQGDRWSFFVNGVSASFSGRWIYIYNAFGAAQQVSASKQNSGSPQGVVSLDVNKDGNEDLLSTAQSGSFFYVPGNGDGTFASAQEISGNLYGTYGIAAGDLDGDGSPDIVVADATESFKVFMQRAPLRITSPSATTFEISVSHSFSAAASDSNVSWSVSGALPTGVSFNSSGVLSGTPAAGTDGSYPLVLTASNSFQQSATQNFTLTVISPRVPVVTNPTFSNVTSSSAHLGGNVASDNGFAITRRGVVYAPTSVNPDPKLGGNGVLFSDDSPTTGNFTRTVTGLSASTNYSFAAFAVNAKGTSYSAVANFQTIAPPGTGSLVVTTLHDEDDGNSDPNVGAGTSLREAVAYANALGGDRAITFSPNLFANGPATITLTLGTVQLANLTGITTIAGPGASQLTIHGNGSSRLFRMDEGSARFNAMTLAGGRWAGAGDGAAIRSFGSLYVNDCVFTDNVTNNNGGAIYNGGLGVIARSTFSDNSSPFRGGAIGNEGTAWVMNCTFSGNSASEGGAIANIYGSSRVYAISSTITNNSATTTGGGLFVNGAFRIAVRNSIISGNSAPADANISGTPDAASSLIGADPAAIFTTGALANNGGGTPTIALKPGGPAVNAGDNSLAVDNNFAQLTTDQRGRPRVVNDTVDIGAYETPVLPTLGASTVANVTANSATLGGNVTGDGFGNIAKRGIVYAVASENPNPTIGGPGVIEIDASGTTGAFNIPVGGLTALTGYSFTSFATNEIGTVYAPVQTFATTEAQSLVVSATSDAVSNVDGQTSLREALAHAESLGGARTITFDPSLAGETVTLSNGWNGGNAEAALRVTGQITLQGLTSSPGVTIAIASGVQKQHILVEPSGNLTVAQLTFTNGYGVNGGSIRSFGTLAVRNCTFAGNHATRDGGAVHAEAGSTSLLIENSTFSGNSTSAPSYSSAVATGALQTTYRHLTVTNNSGGSGALLLFQHPVTMLNSVIAGNAPDGTIGLDGGAFTGQSANNILGSGGTGGLTQGVNGNQVGVPANQLLLGSLGDNGGPTATIPLQPGSPAIDAGVTISAIAVDQRGVTRLHGNAPDIGAFELVQVAAAVPIVSPLGGTYGNSVEVSITSTSANTTIRYTLDGSTPSSAHGQLYTGPFTLTESATVRAIAYGGGWLESPVAEVAYAVVSPLDAWREMHGLAADGSQDLATPAGDGVANLLKYAFNMAPNAGDLNQPNIKVLPENGNAGLPFIEVDEQGRLVIEFVRRKASTNPGITYTVETGDDLSSLTALDLSGASVVEVDGTWERVTVTDPTVTPQRFGRVRVTANQ